MNEPSNNINAEMIYPRPQLKRENAWQLLDGLWDFTVNLSNSDSHDKITYDQRICVPFAPETELSGVTVPDRFMSCWYRRKFEWNTKNNSKSILHFEAVDQTAEVWVNNQYAGKIGGPVRSSLDITQHLNQREQEVVVHVIDDPSDMTQSRGKQDWREQTHIIWYPRTTGIWQSVWIEDVPETSIEKVRFDPRVTSWNIGLDIMLSGNDERRAPWNGWLEVTLTHNDKLLASDRYQVCSKLIQRRITIDDPGVIDERAELTWSPEHPNLIDIDIKLVDDSGNTIDQIKSYTAMRAIGSLDGRLTLNGMPYFSRMVLAQGYWQESGLTAPDDNALRKEVELTKAMGFNGVRLHEKVESERYLYWADRLGLMVWGELGSNYAFVPDDFTKIQSIWIRRVQRDFNHPCVVAWVPVNESWGYPALLEDQQQVHAMRSLYHLTRAIDPTRLVIGNDGWEMFDTDIIAVHDYEGNADILNQRYDLSQRTWPEIFKQEQPGHRQLLLDDRVYENQPVVLSEFGGVKLSDEGNDSWGYTNASDTKDFAQAYMLLLRFANKKDLFGGFCYTQLTDTYQEANGLLKMDRTPKIPIEMINKMTTGANIRIQHYLDDPSPLEDAVSTT
ncbi:Evolved beta-galactosidase subunit alpha [Poriferisphaera corsica]|uniref:Evolved beta-galactosidase subunit alpha n=1 Tax=Poriferisphaera corsica TaxID=2528020 RepID=A0A517YT85_9BACT|nr:glycoside hydrolase family 2 TIM barrel-domain containing protein [Poriferisphaera corsica]QDU33438.1 Evolved beta-galactosidase subunit alpha [Poriferisphaera corsica]